MDITFFLISIRRLTQYNLGSPTGLPAARSGGARARGDETGGDARDAREGLGLDFLARSREVGGQSQGRNRAHTSS